jgi:hypothetical protein
MLYFNALPGMLSSTPNDYGSLKVMSHISAPCWIEAQSHATSIATNSTGQATDSNNGGGTLATTEAVQ